MQTIKLERNEVEFGRGKNDIFFRPTEISISPTAAGDCLMLSVQAHQSDDTEPDLCIYLKCQNWARIIVALGEELGK